MALKYQNTPMMDLLESLVNAANRADASYSEHEQTFLKDMGEVVSLVDEIKGRLDEASYKIIRDDK